MKWVGWALAAVLALAVVVALHDGRRRLAAEEAAVKAQIAAKQAEVDAILERAAEGIPGRQERIELETQKTADLERQLGELEQRKATLDQMIKDLSDTIEAHRQVINDAARQEEQGDAELRAARERIAQLKRQTEILRRAVAMVSERTDP